MIKIISRLSDISDNYSMLFCDLWGCVHNGVAPFREALGALQNWRAQGRHVIFLTNSPRPSRDLGAQFERLSITTDYYDAVVTSGDAARAGLAFGAFGRAVFHIGPERDLPFFEGLASEDYFRGHMIDRVPFDAAEGLVVTGLFDDESETPDDYVTLLSAAQARGLKMLCANPDVVVDRGEKRIYCAGALAERYEEMGGVVHYFGKPHAPIYDLARLRASQIMGTNVKDEDILCIGDGIHTDILGAVSEDLSVVFVTGGLAKKETQTNILPHRAKLSEFLKRHMIHPDFAIGSMR